MASALEEMEEEELNMFNKGDEEEDEGDQNMPIFKKDEEEEEGDMEMPDMSQKAMSEAMSH